MAIVRRPSRIQKNDSGTPPLEDMRQQVKVFHIDRMDVERYVDVPKPNGGSSWELVMVYQDVPCLLSPKTSDKPTEAGKPTAGILIAFKIYCDVDIDLISKTDRVIIRKMNELGEVIETYDGAIGEGAVVPSTKMFEMEMRRL